MRLGVSERYQHDVVFRGLVDVMRSMLENSPEITPTELREAVMLAASMHEFYNIRPLIIKKDDYCRPSDGCMEVWFDKRS